jgi:2-keto-4-pentenoate hydratase/2-oxohepta-3-ene-1,7-dioic acid hydratase in catechol pathway
MKFVTYTENGAERVAVLENGAWCETDLPGMVEALRAGKLADRSRFGLTGRKIDPETADLLPVVPDGEKIICVGLNYADHADESPYGRPEFPTFFPRFRTSLVAHNKPIERPQASIELDWEGELGVVIGRECRNVSRENALEYVAGYTVFNDGSLRNYQFKGQQWTLGKNFDHTGGLGPMLVTADEVPAGGNGLRIQTRLNGETVQDSNTDQLLFPVDQVIQILSEVLTLKPGDLILTGTPSGIGWARKPPVFMKDGDTCEVEIEGLGVLRNPIADEVKA